MKPDLKMEVECGMCVHGCRGVISSYTNKDITLTLPSTLSFTNLKWLSLWCRRFTQDFGNVFFPADLNVPPSMEISKYYSFISIMINRTWYVC